MGIPTGEAEAVGIPSVCGNCYRRRAIGLAVGWGRFRLRSSRASTRIVPSPAESEAAQPGVFMRQKG